MNEVESAAMLAELEGAWTAYDAACPVDDVIRREHPRIGELLDMERKISFAKGYQAGLVNGSQFGAPLDAFAFAKGYQAGLVNGSQFGAPLDAFREGME